MPRGAVAGVTGFALCLVLGAAALAASTNFVEPATSPEPAGIEPRSIAAADLDGDTDQDLAVANQGAANMTILKNTGSGNFVVPSSSPEPVGNFSQSVVAGDLDGDGDQDLAVANFGDSNVTILKNNGTGDFHEAATSPEAADSGPRSIVLARLDGDADLDLAVANESSNNVTILKNTGTGNFREPATSPEPANGGPASIAAANLDGDADQDLAVASFNISKVTILRNGGSGNFTQPASSPEAVGGGPRYVAAADLDGDGDQDLATANEDSGNVTILKNGGTGDFLEPPSSPEPAEAGPRALAVADFEGDGDRDLAVANASNTVTILRNGGSGNFVEPVSSPELSSGTPTAVAAADLDGDADPDLAVANLNDFDVTILRNR
jgi:hypothetical protein